ncbi:MAG: N-acetylmuramoyl-L-alanine amidase [Solirubrobacteraceae bacterium]
MSRVTPRVVVRRTSPNQSSRNGTRPSLIVLHSTESDQRAGSSDLAGVAEYLSRTAVQASSHVITDADGYSARLVADSRKSWAQAAYNPMALSIEQIGRAASEHWKRDEYRETARWIARWSKLWHIPIRVGAVSGGRVLRSGVVTHKMLGAAGGGHVDPGPRYSVPDVLALARFYKAKL